MRISIIAAVAENGVIGRGGQLPWHLADDLRRFKQLTMGHTVIMGRKTWESIGRPLPGRRMIVISRQADYRPENVGVAPSLDTAIGIAETSGENEVFVIGGAEIYRLAMLRADRYYLTLVHAEVEGDAFFVPDFDLLKDWVVLESQIHDADSDNDHAFSFHVFQRCEPNKHAS